MSFLPDTLSTDEALALVLSSTLPPLPPQESHVGAATVSWWEVAPGEIYIHAEGGTGDDRHYGSTLVGLQLAPHGYTRAQFDMDAPFAPTEPFALPGKTASSGKTSAWVDLMAKAKRLIMSNQVHVLRNGYNNIMGHVVGDHGEYDTEISRDDPSSRSITGWQCSCPWDQYAWQRTRKWKKFEGRPCSHVMALYWKALSTPLDEQLSEEQATGMGTGQKIGPGAPGPDTHEFGLPRSVGPEGDVIQGDQQKMFGPEPPGGPAQAPMAPPPPSGPPGPQPPGILPPFPGDQMQMEWGGPGTTPGGGVSPPGAYTVPGAKPQTPSNPVQNPSTYSKVAAPEVMYHVTNHPDAEVTGLDPQSEWGINLPPQGAVFVSRDPQAHVAAGYGRYVYAIDTSGLPMQHYPDHWDDAWAITARVPPERIKRISKTSAKFNAPQAVRAKKPLMGLAEGPVKGQYGDGEYREIPVGSPGEVYSVDDVGGQQWIECRFDLPDSGPNEPFRVVVYAEPGDIESVRGMRPSDPAIRRHTMTDSGSDS